MIRNGGKLTKIKNVTTNSPLNGATGVYDTADAYVARTAGLWPNVINYSVSLNAPTTVYEGGALVITNTSQNLTINTALFYDIENISGDAGQFLNSTSGAFTQFSNQTGSISVAPTGDAYTLDPTRQPVTFRVNIRTGSTTGIIVNTTGIITIPAPTCSVTWETPGDSDESQSGFAVKTLTVRWNNITLYYDVLKTFILTWSGTANPNNDFVGGALVNSVDSTSSSGYAIDYAISPKRDNLTEGTESLTATVSYNSKALGSASFNILDTSLTPVTTITSSKTTVVESTSVRLDVAIVNPDSDTIYYIISGSAAGKFTTQSGTFSLSSQGGITLTPNNNFVYAEADTTFQVSFRTSAGYVYGTSQTITVTDPPAPTGNITAAASIDEGTTNSFTVNTTNADGTSLTWLITKVTGTLTATDFLTATSGTIIPVSGTSTIVVKTRLDTFTEGPETFKLEIKLPSGVVLTSANFTVNDTSTGTTEPVDLYSFTNFTFLAGQTSPTGTSSINYSGDSLGTFVNTIYNTATYPWLTTTSYYNVVTAGIQQWTVPFTGIYRFQVAGAQGGGFFSAFTLGWGGGGAILNGDVLLTRNTVVNIVVGKAGGNGGTAAVGGGGAGGTFVYTGAIGGAGLLFAAGGGGGADDSTTDGQNAREDFYAGTNNAAVRTNPTDGLGAPAGGQGGGSGCGWLSDSTGIGAGIRFTGGLSLSPGGVGGFGGGGGDQDDGGGGGGYTGGTSTTATSGGCGGSYVSTANGVVANYSWGGLNRSTSSLTSVRSGYVLVTALTTGVEATVTPNVSTITEGQSITFNIVTTNYVNGTLYYNLITSTGAVGTNDISPTSIAGAVSIVDSLGQVTFTFNNDSVTEGTETFALLLYYNNNNIKYTLGTSSVISVQDTSTGSAESFSLLNIIQSTQGTVAQQYEITSPPAASFSFFAQGWRLLQNATLDDGFVTVPLPFNFKIDNTDYTNAYVGSNAYITFGAGSSVLTVSASSLASVIPNPKLIWSGGDNSMQRCYYRVDPQNKFVLIRYEGNGSRTGTIGSPGIIAEIKLFNSQFTGGVSVIEIKFQTNRTVSATSARLSLSNASQYYSIYNFPSSLTQYNVVFYATDTAGTTWINTTQISANTYGVIL